MKLIYCATEKAKPITARVRGRDPITLGKEEVRMPCPTMLLKPREIVTVTDAQGEIILERWTGAGVVRIEEEKGETQENALLRGIQRRHRVLVRHLQRYRNEQRLAVARNSEPRLPTQQERDMLAEVKVLRREMEALDPVMNEDLPELAPSADDGDPIADDVRAFGLPKQMAGIGVAGIEEAPF